MTDKSHLTAAETADLLDISLPTLYAYVSRGLLESVPHPENPRKKLYRRTDVDRLLSRKAARKDPTTVASGALNWGEPVLESALTLIRDGELYYRGHDAVHLAQSESIEQVAALMWLDDLDAANRMFSADNRVAPVHDLPEDVPDYQLMQIALNLAASSDYAAYDLQPDRIALAGGRIMQVLLSALTFDPSESIAQTLAQLWSHDQEHAARLIDMALILCADHELNASSFTARIVAGAGGSPYAVVSAGLAALSGVRHGGMTERVEAFLREVNSPSQAGPVIGARMQRGDPIPGFGHRLYPDGDPRAAALLAALSSVTSPRLELIDAVSHAAQQITGQPPTIDFGLCALAHVLKLPPGAPLILFALGRTVGWIAHAIEQSQTESLIRPRARYVGRLPD
jgi:citrate synthase